MKIKTTYAPRPFTENDFSGLSGAENFLNGALPLLAEIEIETAGGGKVETPGGFEVITTAGFQIIFERSGVTLAGLVETETGVSEINASRGYLETGYGSPVTLAPALTVAVLKTALENSGPVSLYEIENALTLIGYKLGY